MTTWEPSALPARHGEGEHWVSVSNGPLVQPIKVKVEIVLGRAQIVGLCLDNGTPITSRALRQIPLGTIARGLYHYFDNLLSDSELPVDERRRTAEWAELDLSGVDASHAHFMTWISSLQFSEEDSAKLHVRTRGMSRPSDAEYQAFAYEYLLELQESEHEARKRTATNLKMDRSTVYRWVRQCERLGYLPKEKRQ